MPSAKSKTPPPPPASAMEPAAPSTIMDVVPVSTDDIEAWSENPRKFSEDAKFSDLVLSVKNEGILQNLVLRPNPNQAGKKYLVVIGERRWRAAVKNLLPTVPAKIREMTERAAYELAVVENVIREDMSPLDEATAYQKMIVEWKYSIEDIAAKVTKPALYIRRRMLLCALVPGAAELLRAEKLTIGGAEELARVSQKVQTDFVETINRNAYLQENTYNAQQVRNKLRNEYLRELVIVTAPFDVKDAQLVEGAPPCAQCPKNTAAQRLLFGDPKDGRALCTDPICWEKKAQAAAFLIKKKAAEGGATIISGTEADKLFESYGPLKRGKGLIDLSDVCYHQHVDMDCDDEDDELLDCDDDESEESGEQKGGEATKQYRAPARRQQTYGELVKKALEQHPEDVVVIEKSDGEVVQCVRSEKLSELLATSGHKDIAKSVNTSSLVQPARHSDAQKRASQEKIAEEHARHAGIAKVGEFIVDRVALKKDGPDDKLWQVLSQIVLMLWKTKGSAAAARRDFGSEAPKRETYGDPRAKLPKEPRLESMTEAELFAFFIELFFEEEAKYYTQTRQLEVFSLIGIDYKALVKQKLQALRDKDKERASKKKTAEKKSSKKEPAPKPKESKSKTKPAQKKKKGATS